MRILGYTIMNLLSLMLLGTTLVLFTVLPIRPPVENTLEAKVLLVIQNPTRKKEKSKTRI